MKRIGPEKLHLGVTPFKWGIYFHLRIGYMWHHIKCGFWTQRGLRLTTRKAQKKFGRTPIYVDTLRFNVSYWKSWKGYAPPKRAFGFMMYWR